MKKILLKIRNFLIISVITILLLELCSMLILALFFNEQVYNVANLRIFERTTANGVIDNQGADWVMPVKPNLEENWNYNDFQVTVKTNNRGLRESFEVIDDAVDIAFFGDSFTFGHGVENEERYSYQFAQDPNFINKKVVSFSYPNGWQPEHYEYYLKKHPNLKPEHSIIGLYLGNDFDSDLNETIYDRESLEISTPYRVVSKEGFLRNRPDIYRFPINPLIHYSSFVKLVVIQLNATTLRENLFADKAVETNRLNNIALEKGELEEDNRALIALQEIKTLLQERGSQLTVLIIPQDYYFCKDKASAHIHPDLAKQRSALIEGNNLLKATKKALEKLEIDYFDPSSILEATDYFKIDVHWSAQGHQKIGKALAKHLAEK